MRSRTVMAIDIGRLRLRGLLAVRDGGILRVRSTVLADVPEGVDPDNAEAFGAWVGNTLSEAGFPRGFGAKAVIALAREHVALKRLTLPTDDEGELPDMTRLAMARELPFDAQKAVIDFVPIAKTDTSTTVLAVAVKREALDHALAVAKAARIGVERVSIRNLGSALLLRHLDAPGRESESILALDIIGESLEFCVVESPQRVVRFSRAAEAVPWRDVDLVVDTVMTETRRTWMSYRIAEDSSEIRHVVIMGERRVAEEVAEPMSDMLGVEAEVLRAHPLVDPGGNDLDRCWPLAGLLLEPAHGGATIDFAHPRKAPDVAAERRKRAIFAAAACALVLLALWTFARTNLAQLEAQVADMRSQSRSLYPDYVHHARDKLRIEHIEHWMTAHADWLEHLMYLSTITPPPEQVVLDEWSGELSFRSVGFDRSSRTWSAPKQILITVSGEARDRVTADAFREALVRADLYVTSSTGTDAAGGRRLPYGFTYRLRTETASPEVGEPEAAAASRGKGPRTDSPEGST